MNINNDYQKSRGRIISFTTGVIEPNKKYLENNSFYPISNFFIGNTGNDTENKYK